MLYIVRNENSKELKFASTLAFVEWDKTDAFAAFHDNVGIGRSIILDRNDYGGYAWLTTGIKSIESNIVDEVNHFTRIEVKTANSTYSIHIYPFLTKENAQEMYLQIVSTENFIPPDRP